MVHKPYIFLFTWIAPQMAQAADILSTICVKLLFISHHKRQRNVERMGLCPPPVKKRQSKHKLFGRTSWTNKRGVVTLYSRRIRVTITHWVCYHHITSHPYSYSYTIAVHAKVEESSQAISKSADSIFSLIRLSVIHALWNLTEQKANVSLHFYLLNNDYLNDSGVYSECFSEWVKCVVV